jgi:hydroxyethylthiazole kinase-like sugar kinase family protein
MNNVVSALVSLKTKRKREDPRIGRVVNSIISARITNRLKYINASPYMSREEKNFVRNKVRNENATLDQIKKFEKVMKVRKMIASKKFLESAFTPRKNVKR